MRTTSKQVIYFRHNIFVCYFTCFSASKFSGIFIIAREAYHFPDQGIPLAAFRSCTRDRLLKKMYMTRVRIKVNSNLFCSRNKHSIVYSSKIKKAMDSVRRSLNVNFF